MTNESFHGITIIGLGPGKAELITRETWDWINSLQEIYLRTAQHPVLADFPLQLKIHSFDSVYDQTERFEDVYQTIVDEIIRHASDGEDITYGVPGHPYVAESTCDKIVKQAVLKGIPCRVLEAVSFLEPIFTALGLDPFPNLILMDALEISDANFPQFPPSRPVLIAQVYSRMIAAEVKQTLLEVFPDEHPVKLIHAAGTTTQIIESLPLYEIDRSPQIGILTSPVCGTNVDWFFF